MSKLTYRNPVTAEQKRVFLEAVSKGYSITAAAALSGHSRQAFYQARGGHPKRNIAGDPEFAAAWADAVESGADVLEDEARRRAVEGDLVQTFDKDGNVLRVETRYSDRLLELLLKARRPQVFRENVRHEHSGALEVTNPDVTAAIDRFSAQIRQLARPQPGEDVLPAGRAAAALPPGGSGG